MFFEIDLSCHYAVVYAANHASDPKPIPIIAKSVCDFADSSKSDDYQRFAAYSSCEFTKILYEKILPMGEDDMQILLCFG